MQRYENITGIIADAAELAVVEAAVDAFIAMGQHTTWNAGWYGNAAEATAANNARLQLKAAGIAVTVSAIMWRAGRFPRHNEQGPFWFYTAA